jgi:phosphoglycerate dehydrogenase-like enzyme
MSGPRVLVDVPPFPLEVVRELLADTGVTVEAPPGPWSGDDVVGLLVWGTQIREADLVRLPRLEVVSTCSVGYDHIDVTAASHRGVVVCNVPDYCVEEMADSTLALLLALLRGVVVLDRSVRAGRWDDRVAGPLGRLAGTRLGVVGFGRIGRALAVRADALGLEVWATDPFVDDTELEAAGVRAAGLDELLAACRAVTLHLPLTAETEGLIGERELALMPPGSFLVNTARAGLLDWSAFLRALESGHLAAAAVDTLPVEPPTHESPAPEHPTLLVTPHAAWYSPEAEREVYRRATLAVRAVLEGRRPETGVVGP